MKKILVILVLIIASFSLIQSVQATSGACSYHGGVSCGAGPDWDGSAICNDGWRDSSELFSQAIACQNTQQKYPCTESELAQLDIKYGVPELEKQYDDAFAKSTALFSEYYALKASIDSNSFIGNQAQTLAAKSSEALLSAATVEGLRAKYKLAYDQSLRECYVLGAVEYQKKLQQALKEIEDIKQQSALEQQKTLLKQLQTQCSSNSTLKTDGKCYCDTGYTKSNLGLGCVKLDNWCTEQYPNTHYDTKQKKCDCLNGYGALDNKCIPIGEYCLSKYGNNSISIDNACTCKPGYNWNSNETSCVKDNDSETNEHTTLKTYISTKQRINIRKSPSSSTKILSVTTPNKKYEMLSQNKDWVEVRLGKTNGWIMKKYVKFQ